MKDLSLHILDIIENSVKAEANNISLNLIENDLDDLLLIEITDDGRGMDSEMLKTVTDPFVTSGNKKVGLGIPLLKFAAEMANGKFSIDSDVAKGTKITATFQLSHIDRKPIGDIAETLKVIVEAYPRVNFKYSQNINGEIIEYDFGKILK